MCNFYYSQDVEYKKLKNSYDCDKVSIGQRAGEHQKRKKRRIKVGKRRIIWRLYNFELAKFAFGVAIILLLQTTV